MCKQKEKLMKGFWWIIILTFMQSIMFGSLFVMTTGVFAFLQMFYGFNMSYVWLYGLSLITCFIISLTVTYYWVDYLKLTKRIVIKRIERKK